MQGERAAPSKPQAQSQQKGLCLWGGPQVNAQEPQSRGGGAGGGPVGERGGETQTTELKTLKTFKTNTLTLCSDASRPKAMGLMPLVHAY